MDLAFLAHNAAVSAHFESRGENLLSFFSAYRSVIVIAKFAEAIGAVLKDR
jgi:hypothetical protein